MMMMMMIFRSRRIRSKYLKIRKKNKQIEFQRIKNKKKKNWIVVSEDIPFKMFLSNCSFLNFYFDKPSTYVKNYKSYFVQNKYPFYKSVFKIFLKYNLLYKLRNSRWVFELNNSLLNGFLFFFPSMYTFFKMLSSLPMKFSYTFLHNTSFGHMVIFHKDIYKFDQDWTCFFDRTISCQFIGIVLNNLFIEISYIIDIFKSLRFFLSDTGHNNFVLPVIIDPEDPQLKLKKSKFSLLNVLSAPVILQHTKEEETDKFDEQEYLIFEKNFINSHTYSANSNLLKVLENCEYDIKTEKIFNNCIWSDFEYCLLIPQIILIYANI